MPLRTDYTNDILDTSKNTERKYNIKNSNGTIVEENVTFEDVTDYEQKGSRFGANDINEAFAKINKLTAQDGLEFDLQVDEDGNYGMLDKQGEFLSFGGQSMELYSDFSPIVNGKSVTNSITRKYTFNKKCTVTATVMGYGVSAVGTITATGGTKIADNMSLNYNNQKIFAETYQMEEGGTLTLYAKGFMNSVDNTIQYVGITATTDDFTSTTI